MLSLCSGCAIGTKSGSPEMLNTFIMQVMNGGGPDTPSGFKKRWQSFISPCLAPSPGSGQEVDWEGCCSCPSPWNQTREVPRKSEWEP